MPKHDLPKLVMEEALDALLMRVRWYVCRGHKVPESLALSFNYLCGVLKKPDVPPYHRIKVA